MDSLFAAVDNYCERIDTHFWSEPLNAVTNLSFLIAAWLLYKEYKRLNLRQPALLVLIGLIMIVGCGSFVFHTFANIVGMFADIIPIVAFVCIYLCMALRILLHCSGAAIFIALATFILASMQVMGLPPEYNFNGSASYFMCPVTLAVIAILLYRKHHPAAQVLFKACALFVVSLTFRTVDITFCNAFPIGTHFLWHILNSLVLYMITNALLMHRTFVNK